MTTPATEMFTQLPVATNANMSDIIAAVQGYSSPSSLGSLNQETLQQVFNLFQANVVLSFPGNPNGFVAGTPFQFLWDTNGMELYVNTVYGSAMTAVWTLVTEPSPASWSTVNSATFALLSNNGYVINYSLGSVTLSLPLVSNIGDELIIMGFSSNGYSITQAAGQQIIIAGDTTTLGVGGSIATTNQYDAITLKCMVANSIWGVSAAVQGIYTII